MKIFYIMGKSATGKDTIFSKIKSLHPELSSVTSYTTRPKRAREENGREYFFTDFDFFQEKEKEGKVIESRTYMTKHGPWIYFTLDDGQIRDDRNYVMIGTLESYKKLLNYYGNETMIPVYIQVSDDDTRLKRSLAREMKQKHPDVKEVCRRFLADEEDFSEENIKDAGILKRYENISLEECVGNICNMIQEVENQ